VNRYAAWPTVVADGHDTLYMRESWLVRWHVFFVSSFRDWICTIQSRGGFVRRGPDRLKVAGCHYHGYSSEALLPLQVLVAWLNVQLCSNLTSVHGLLVSAQLQGFLSLRTRPLVTLERAKLLVLRLHNY
jgi:hypothetical protein